MQVSDRFENPKSDLNFRISKLEILIEISYRCDDGYKGEDCSKEDQLVILLKDTLMIVSVGLGLMLVVVIAIAVFCIKR